LRFKVEEQEIASSSVRSFFQGCGVMSSSDDISRRSKACDAYKLVVQLMSSGIQVHFRVTID